MTFIWISVGIVIVTVALALTVSLLQPPPPPNLSDEHIRTALREGKPLTALRWYRSLHRVDLKRAKSGVALLAAEQPAAASDERAKG